MSRFIHEREEAAYRQGYEDGKKTTNSREWAKGLQEGGEGLFRLMRQVAAKSPSQSIGLMSLHAFRTHWEWVEWARKYVNE